MPHSRRIPVPMHIGFTESNSILNNGTPNTLNLRFTNLDELSDLDFSSSNIKLEFIIGSNNEDHILGDVNQVTGIQIQTKANFTVTPPASGAITDVSWTLSSATPANLLDSYSKSPGTPYFDVQINNIKSEAQIGTTFLFVTVSHVVGNDPAHPHKHVHFAPTKFKIDIQKSNFKMIDDRLGIGTSDPREMLEIKKETGNPVMTFHSANVASYKLGNHGSVFKIAAMDNGFGGHRGDFTLNNTQVISLTDKGLVGVGTTNPLAKFHLDGNAIIKGPLTLDGWSFNTNPVKNYQLYLTPPRSGESNFYLGPNLNFKINESFFASHTGNVGIGTTDPRELLEIKKNSSEGNPVMTFHSANVASHKIGNDGSVFKIAAMDNGYGGHVGDFAANDTQVISLTGKGLVGIGTTSPSKAKLVVEGYVNQNGIVGAYINQNEAGKRWTHGVHDVSLYTSGTIWSGNTVIASSDERIKVVEGISDSASDLGLLNKIEITNYKLKDSIQFGETKIKKILAQQVKEVYPQAVSISTHEIPDIYKKASIKNGWVNLTTNLKIGEEVQLIIENSKKLFKVLDVNDNGFQVDCDKTLEIFVYGRQVDDFLSVDYDAISMLNVSATQELTKQFEALKSENSALKDVTLNQEKRIRHLEEKLELFLNKMSLS